MGGLCLPPPPQAQKLKKSPGEIGLSTNKVHYVALRILQQLRCTLQLRCFTAQSLLINNSVTKDFIGYLQPLNFV